MDGGREGRMRTDGRTRSIRVTRSLSPDVAQVTSPMRPIDVVVAE